MNALNLKWEMVGVAGTAILMAKTNPRLSTVPRTLKWLHWGLIGVYSLVGIAGFRVFLMLWLNHQLFVEAFSQPNALGVRPALMQWIALIFSLTAMSFYFVVMELGRFRRTARTLFSCLVVPNSVLYPIVMLSASGLIGRFDSALSFARGAVLTLLALACLSIFFYRSRSVTERIDFW
jgi:hypothetical protein